MNKRPFLLNFKQEVPLFDIEEALEEDKYSETMQMSVLPSGDLTWSAYSRRRPTSCYTSAHMVKGGYTRSGRYKSSHMVKGKMDKRAGK
jgi:hypothetical protein